MKADCNEACFQEWKDFAKASPFMFNIIVGLFYSEDSDTDWPKIRSAMCEVRRVLQEKYDELYSKKEEPKKPEFEPIEICCLEVSVDSYYTDRIRITTQHSGGTCAGHGYGSKKLVERLNPKEVRALIFALQAALNFLENK